MEDVPEPKQAGRKLIGSQNQQSSNIFGGEPEKSSIKVIFESPCFFDFF